MAAILDLLNLAMGTIETGLQQSGMECLHREVLRREVNASVSEAAPYFRRSENMPSGPVTVSNLIEQMSLKTSSLGSGITSAHSFGNCEAAESLRG